MFRSRRPKQHLVNVRAAASGSIDIPEIPRISPREVADILLVAAIANGAHSLHVGPISDADYRVTMRSGAGTVSSATFDRNTATRVIDRMLILADLDLGLGAAQSGRFVVDCDGELRQVFLAGEVGALGATLELWLVSWASVTRPTVETTIPLVELSEGDSIGPYIIENVLGEGGMGIVYRARHRVLDSPFAIKVLRTDTFRADPRSVGRFYAEARAAARVHHPGVVRVSDASVLDDGRPYLVMELIEGLSLAEVIDTDGALAAERAIGICRSIASALMALHERGVVHCDLTPSNIFLVGRPGGIEAKLLDFGVARIHGVDAPPADDGDAQFIAGTPYYVSPEQVSGNPCGPRSDLYSLGIVLFEMLSGAVPFEGDSVRSVLVKHLAEAPRPVASPHARLPGTIVHLVRRLLMKRPADRFRDARELVASLDRIAMGSRSTRPR